MSTSNGQASVPANERRLALRWRLLISAAIALHLTAVLAAPLALPPSSEVEQSVAATFRPYILTTYLDHGYRFFAPAPGPSHLVRYTLEMPDGTSRSGTFPDVKTEWPRLFYHRHFMLSEHLNMFFRPAPPAGAPAEDEQERRWAMPIFESVARSYAQYLLRSTDAKRVKLELVEHTFPEANQVADEHRQLTDPGSYAVIWENTYEPEPL
jgi:hypothetical protein